MKIGIIGGGASGMFLASLLKTDNEVTIIERNAKLGKKLLLTGNGKCNFTSDDFSELKYIYNNDFARNIYIKYDRDCFLDFMKSIGVDPKLEYHKGIGYYYPASNKSLSIYYALYDKLTYNKTNIIYEEKVIEIIINDNIDDAQSGSFKFSVITDKNRYNFDKVVIATGGMSYKNTGSDGSLYNILERLGYNIIRPVPGLVGFKHSDSDLKGLKGMRVDASAVAMVYGKLDKKLIAKFTEVGEIQFTEKYVSGIPMMNLSRYVNRYISEGYEVKIMLNLYNNETIDDAYSLYEYLKDRREKIYYRNIKDFLVGMLPDEIGSIVLKRSRNGKTDYGGFIRVLDNKERFSSATYDYIESVSNMSDEFIKNIAYNIENFIVSNIDLASFDNAQVTLGGVDTKDVIEETLESKIHKGLYFIGEVLDIDGRCGGYNLQLAYSTARLVSNSIL